MATQERRLVCTFPGCNKMFKEKTHMLQHQEASHIMQPSKSKPRPKTFMVEVKTTVTSAPTTPGSTSQILLSKKQLACSECGHKFGDYRSLQQHQQASPSHRIVSGKHNGDRSACRECMTIFDLPAHLEQHYLAKHPVISLRKDDPRRIRVTTYFLSKWTHAGPKGSIIDILAVYNPGHRTKRFEDYRAKLKQSRARLKDSKMITNGNEVQRFHGTTIRCGLGVSGEQQSLCSNVSCSLCNILLSGFKKKKAVVGGFLRFGAGIYVTATSSKANDYVKAYSGSDGVVGRRRAMLVSRVLAGRVYKVKVDMPDLNRPPDGYDSVSGEVGLRLNYDELVIYDDAAILPDFVIVYDYLR